MKTEIPVCDQKVVCTPPNKVYLKYELKVVGYRTLEYWFLILVVKYNIIPIASIIPIWYVNIILSKNT